MSIRSCIRYLSVCDNVLEVCECGVLHTAFENFTRFTSKKQLKTKMNQFGLRSKGQRSRS